MKKPAIFHPFLFHPFFLFFILSTMVDCYVSMGGNFPNTLFVMRQVALKLNCEKKICHFKLSRLYCTTPVKVYSESDNDLSFNSCYELKDGNQSKLKPLAVDEHKQAFNQVVLPFYLNAICRFQTQLSLNNLWDILQNLEQMHGKKPKPKNAPRLIDLDLIFYGSLISETKEWTIPHPRWHERLFVLAPLADVTKKIPLEGGLSVQELINTFANPHQEKIYIHKEKIL